MDGWWYCIAGDCIRWSFIEYGSSEEKFVDVLKVRNYYLACRDANGFENVM